MWFIQNPCVCLCVDVQSKYFEQSCGFTVSTNQVKGVAAFGRLSDTVCGRLSGFLLLEALWLVARRSFLFSEVKCCSVQKVYNIKNGENFVKLSLKCVKENFKKYFKKNPHLCTLDCIIMCMSPAQHSGSANCSHVGAVATLC